MASPQTGIFALGTASHAYLEFDLLPSADPAAAVALVGGLREPRTTIGGSTSWPASGRSYGPGLRQTRRRRA